MPPTQLLNSLEALRRRARTLSVLYGVALVVLGVFALLTVGTLADYLLRLPGVPRLIGLLLALAALIYICWRYVYRPAVARLTLTDVAGKVEEAFPQFDDRLRSSVQFLGEHDTLATDPLRRRTVEQAGDIARGLDLRDVLVAKPAYLMTTAAALAIGILVILGFLLGPLAGVIAGRLFDPLDSAHQWPTRYAIAPISLDDRVPAGRRVMVSMQLERGNPQKVEPVVLYQVDDGPVRRLLMTPQTDGTFTAAVDTRLGGDKTEGNLHVWVEAGDAKTPRQIVSVVPQLALTGAAAVVTPPAYVPGGGARQVDLADGPVVTAAGSEIRLALRFNKSLAEGAEGIELSTVGENPVPQLAWARPEQGLATTTFTAEETLRFQVNALDRDGFTADVPQTFEVIVRPDQTPGVQIENPRRNESRTPVAIVPLVAMADDDYGFREISLVVRRLGEAPGDVVQETIIPLYHDGTAAEGVALEPAADAPDRVRLRLSREWDLAQTFDTPLQPGDVLEYYVVAQDNYERNGEYHDPVESGRLRITIISQQELSQRTIRELRDVKDQIAATKQAQDRNRRETAELGEQTQAKPELDEADRAAAGRLSRQQSAAAASTKRLSDKVAEIGQSLQENRSTAQDLQELTENVEQSLDRTAEGPMKESAAQLDQAASEQSAAEQAKAALEQSQQRQTDASERLRQAIEQMDEIGSLRSTIDQMQSLLEAQKELGEQSREHGRNTLGKRPEDLTEQERQKSQELADRQQELAEQTEGALEKMQELSEEMKESDPASAESMKQAAQTGQQQQVPQQQRQAAQSQRQNQRDQAQRAQQQAEIGLEMVLNELREAERRKLQELQKKLAEMQEQVERLIRRQAGHNLDNRTLAGEELPAEPLAELRELAGIEGEDPVKPTLPRLSTGQEQTERNTRDLSRTAEDLPEGAEIANLLTRASARMERAAVFLRQKALGDAYDPPQTEALAALREALGAVDQQRQQVEEEIANQAKETIREKLAQIRDEQLKNINEPTSQLQQLRDENKFNPRRDQIRLNQLPGHQAVLGERVDGLGEDLAAIGGTAFVYANKQIKGLMDTVQGRLDDNDTGRATQTQQKRIVDGLEAMIESLKVTPPEERFAENNNQAGGGGGQGGQQGPTLPPEAELRLTKHLQEGINDATIDLAEARDAAPEPQKAAVDEQIAQLGTEQGELRDVLDNMLQKYSQGKMKLGPEPDPEEPLPEEAGEGAVEDQELVDDLLGENAGQNGESGDASRIGDRMARSRQRLALNRDPGQTTQIIQRRILEDIDLLIQEAQNQQQQASSQQQQQQNGRRPQQQPGQQPQQAQNQGQNQPGQPQPGTEAAQQSGQGPPGGEADLSAELKESLAEWGQLTPRQRAAILDTQDEQILDQYRQIIEDYYRTLNQKRSQQQ